MQKTFEFGVASPPGMLDPSIAIAAARAHALGILDLEYAGDLTAARNAIEKLVQFSEGPKALKLDVCHTNFANQVIADWPTEFNTVILAPASADELSSPVQSLKESGVRVLLEVTNLDQGRVAEDLAVDAVIAKGHESAGQVADETTFVLMQRLLSELSLPVWAFGGIGLHTVAACYTGGASGVILASQMLLAKESPLSDSSRSVIARFDGSETTIIGDELNAPHRVFSRPRLPIVERMQEFGLTLSKNSEANQNEKAEQFRAEMRNRAVWDDPENSLWILGQDAAFAKSLADQFHTVGGIIEGMRQSIDRHVELARRTKPINEHSPLAESLGTRYPIAQGPMTRVSDRATFAASVAEQGGLPFLALALLRGPDLRTLFEETRDLLGDRPWGVGILGFVPLELRQEQLEVIREFNPPFALIAGGRPDQAQILEKDGIPTFLHVPSPSLLQLFLDSGTRRFVFEGRECGGHVGPRTSFVLWEMMIDVLLNTQTDQELSECHILFAGGVHDDISASMVATMAAPLAARGAKIGVLMGTAYILTAEAVESGAILPGFQKTALECQSTALLETGPGHATRCAITPFASSFLEQKQELLQQGVAPEEIRNTLEDLNLGRLRVATKGITRNQEYKKNPDAPKLINVEEAEQLSQGMYMIGQVAALSKRVSTIADLHHNVSIGGTQRLEANEDDIRVIANGEASQPLDIAIVGMSCVLPQAPNIETYWNNILNKVYAIGEVPKKRWDSDLYFDADRHAKDKIYSKWGGFIDPIEFDPLEFGMPPNSLNSVDPMQILALQAARNAIEDAGYLNRPFDRAGTSVILGTSGGLGDMGVAYVLRTSLPQVLGDQAADVIDALGDQLPVWTEDSFAGLLPNVAAGRIANRLDLGGLNYVVDAACASSLAALNSAVNDLKSGNTNMVIVGGVDTIQSPFGYMCFSKTQALSPNGRPRTFDAEADGIAIGEGVTMLVLKRRVDAERDGDRIYAVIRAVAGASDGKAKGLTAPRIDGQVSALKRAYKEAGFSASTVGLFEAHGTGTVVGDRTEALSLAEHLDSANVPSQSIAIGSVKSMIGHTKATAGVAGLAKVAMSLYHKVLPPTMGVTEPNPAARLHDGPLYVNSETRPWINGVDGHARRAGVSSFGFGGTNFHTVLEEYDGNYHQQATPTVTKWPSELFRWTATSKDDLLSQITTLEAAFAKDATPNPGDLAGMLERQFQTSDSVNLAIVAESLDDLKGKLATVREQLQKPETTTIQDPRGVYLQTKSLAEGSKTAFLFPGQGSQYPDMLRDLAVYFPEVRATFERADQLLADQFPEGLSSYIFPPPRFNDDAEQRVRGQLSQTNVAQPALGATSMAMLTLLKSLGLDADFTAGHSYGEYTALHAANAFDDETFLNISEARGRFIIEAAEGDLGTMAAASASAEEVAKILDGMADVWVANKNSPKQTVISGTEQGITAAVARLKEQGIRATRFAVSCGFHSPLVAPAKDRLAEFLTACEFKTPTTEVYSNTTATPYPSEPKAIISLLSGHLEKPVEFQSEVEAMYEAGARLFIEIGPGNVLTNLTRTILGDQPHVAVATDSSKRHGIVQLLHALAQLSASGIELRCDRLYEGRADRDLNMKNLVAKTQPPKPSATTWLVDGGRSLPIHAANAESSTESTPAVVPSIVVNTQKSHTKNQEQPTREPAPSPAPPVPQAAESSKPKNDMTVHSESPEPIPTPRPASIPGNTQGGSPGVDDVMAQYQQMMNQFLQTQERIMMGFLNGSTGTSTSANQTPSANPVSHPPLVAQPEQPNLEVSQQVASPPDVVDAKTTSVEETSVPSMVETAAPVGIDRTVLTERLLQLVSDRTGYPTDMLDPNLDIEAELGIDSIKRVEVLASLQNDALLESWEPGESDMETLLKIKTMNGIVDWLVDNIGATEAPAAPQTAQAQSSAVATAAPVGIDRTVLTERLLQLVSDRTGYPTDMLDPNLDIEAELGIDSIKRVEVLASLQNDALLESWEPGESDMETLLKIKTMNGIVDWLVDNIGATEAPAAPQTAQAQSPTAATTAPVGIDRTVLTERLLQLVSDRTGYPTDMLDPNLDIEAELGIDSIKRVEVLASLQNDALLESWEPGESDMETLLKIKTMNGIVDWLVDNIGATEAPAATSVASKNADNEPAASSGPESAPANGVPRSEHVPRFLFSMYETPASDAVLPVPKSGQVIITNDGRGIAQSLQTRLSASGITSVIAESKNDLGDREAINQFVIRLQQQAGPIAGIIHLLPLSPQPAGLMTELADFQTGWRRDLKTLFDLTQACNDDLNHVAGDGPAWVVSAAQMGGTLGSDYGENEAIVPTHGALAGYIKTLALELTDVRCKLIDFDSAMIANPESASSAIITEMAQESRREEVEAGYRNNTRLIPRPVLAPLSTKTSTPLEIDDNSVLVITGGARGITATIAIEFAQKYQSKIVLCGRSPEPDATETGPLANIESTAELKPAIIEQFRNAGKKPVPADIEREYNRIIREREMRTNLSRMKELGSEVHYHQVDVRNPEEFAQFINNVYKSHGRIDGVVHGAGVIEDKLIKDKTSESFDRVFETKTNSAFVLNQTLRPEALKFVVLFASMAGRFGNRGQCDYAAANDLMNKLAVEMSRRLSARIVSANWGPWLTGMVSPEVRQQFEQRGVQLIPPADGARVLMEELQRGSKNDIEIVFGDGPWQTLAVRDTHESALAQLPLLGNTTGQPKGNIVEYKRTLSVDEDLYLLDHQLDGKPVLPLAGAMEFAAEVVQQSWPELKFVGVDSMKLFNGIIVEDKTKEIRITARQHTDPSFEDLDVRVDVEIFEGDEAGRPSYRGTVILSPEYPPEKSYELASFSSLNAFPLTLDDCYERWLFHGPRFQNVTELLGNNEHGVKAIMQSSSPDENLTGNPSGDWLIDPILLDCGFQLGILWERVHYDMTPLPSRVESYRKFAADIEGPVTCFFVAKPSAQGRILVADILFYNAEGNVVFAVENMESACSKELNRLAEPMTEANPV